MPPVSRRDFLRIASASAVLVGTGAAGREPARAGEPKAAGTTSERTGFAFLHSYESTGRYWRGLEKAGLLRESNGVRLVNSPWGEDSRRFNESARRGGPLDAILQKRKCPFIIDRVVGGSQYCPYTFDQELVAYYRSLLGGKFLGGQVHETISNLHVDWGRLAQAYKTLDKRPVTAADLRGYFTGNDAPHWLDYARPEDYAGRTPPATEEDWWREIRRAALAQGARFGSRFSYCEGSHFGRLAWHAFYRFGAAYCLAEVGPWASDHTPLAIASLRGAARAAGKPWGVFFAPWGPKGCTCFVPPEATSWRLSPESWRNSGYPIGPQYGCSSATQRRIFFHAFLSGAHTLHEEWGAECNLLDWERGTLSSYGQATREFLDFQDVHPDVGTPYTPIALVSHATVPPPSEAAWKDLTSKLFQATKTDAENAARPGSGKEEAACYPSCALPELFDVVPSDAPAELWKTYAEIIPVGSAPVPSGAKACAANEVFEHLADAVRRRSPFARTTHLPMQVNHRESDGAWIVGLYNPWGAVRGDVDRSGSRLCAECATSDVLRPAFPVQAVRALYAWPASSQATLREGVIPVTVGPGGTLILEIRPA